MGAPFTVAKEALYLELGCTNIEAIIKGRRVNYLHYLVTQNSDTMLYRFFVAQWKQTCKHDWTKQVKLDLLDLGITDNLQSIKEKSKLSFKSLVKTKVKEYAFLELIERKSKHSKMKDLFYQVEVTEYELL